MVPSSLLAVFVSGFDGIRDYSCIVFSIKFRLSFLILACVASGVSARTYPAVAAGDVCISYRCRFTRVFRMSGKKKIENIADLKGMAIAIE